MRPEIIIAIIAIIICGLFALISIAHDIAKIIKTRHKDGEVDTEDNH